jgi:ribonuclease HIII
MIDRTSQTLVSLKKSEFRSKLKLSIKDRQYIQDKGIDTIMRHAIDFIKTRIAPQNPKNDGKQTPMRGHPVFIAQHATATCCRSCIQKWHGIKKDKELSDQEIQFLVELIMGWILEQFGSI